MKIPISNFYYLLCYAWDKLEESKVIGVTDDDYGHIVDLFARVLASGMEHLLKRGLDQGYQEYREVFGGVRGKIDFGTSLKAHLFPQGRAACVFEQLTHDVLHNRILKSTMATLLRHQELDPRNADALGACLARLSEVTTVRLDASVFSRVQLHSNNGVYDFLLRVCRLIHDATVIEEKTGQIRFRDFERDDAQMAALYERFLLNFYKREQNTFRAGSEVLRWQATFGEEQDLLYLPSMRTDVSLQSADRKIVIDAKYYTEVMQTNFGKDTVRSGHLYQLFAYLKNMEYDGGPQSQAEGILLYPLVDTPLNLQFRIQGHTIRVVTIDMAQDWPQIHDHLLRLIAPCDVEASRKEDKQ